MFIAGFGPDAKASAPRLAQELEIPVESLDSSWPGLAGYLESLSAKAASAKAKTAKVNKAA